MAFARWALASAASLASLALVACGGSGDGPSSAASGEAEPPFDTSAWRTDFAEHSVPLDEFKSGGPPKDGIASIDEPKFVSTREADRFLDPAEPVAVVELGGTVRAYPIQIVTLHEIVNDTIDGQPVALTFCPLCNSTVAFRREIDGESVEFGTTGMLRNSDLVMYDRRTESWWQQITAEALVGELTGEELEVLPSQILSWGQVMKLHPDSEVLSTDTGFDRDYGQNPYTGYDSDPESQPFLFEGEPDDSLPAKERVASVRTGESAVVYPFTRLRREAPVNDEIDGRPVVVFFDPDVASALDTSEIAKGDAVGGAAVFERRVKGRKLSFEAGDAAGEFRDVETGSEWDMSGRATAGPLADEQLEQIAHDDQFWFYEDPDIRG